MKPWIVIGYYTRNTLYENKAKEFIESLESYKIPYYVEAIDNLGSWHKNTAYKPTFIKRMMEKFAGEDIIYVDCDAKFFAYPKLFDDLDCDIAVYELDRSCYRGGHGTEVLSGTIFLRNNLRVLKLVEEWERKCQKSSLVVDQKHLEKVLAGNFYKLPPQYCKIFDTMRHVENQVIVHYQASRIIRRNGGEFGGVKMH